MRRTVTAVVAFGALLSLGAKCEPAAEPSPTASATTSATASAEAAGAEPSATASTASPKVEKRTVTETKVIPFRTRRVTDPGLAKGTTKVRTRGRTGIKTLTYEVTFTNGRKTRKKLIRQVVTKAAVTRIVAVGTKQSSRCDPNYSPCVPIASDVDCAGGSGNGPAYVQGPVRVIDTDIYDLDRDGDGVGCDD
ncbi:G5 domain-containing protein [Actinomadura sp. NPDC047616]|uniref:G5 domain-containing protein n=1 Tax=Actinomadura sp. NPDC047616 TaxID=3155914 RepID=UPI0033E69BED